MKVDNRNQKHVYPYQSWGPSPCQSFSSFSGHLLIRYNTGVNQHLNWLLPKALGRMMVIIPSLFGEDSYGWVYRLFCGVTSYILFYVTYPFRTQAIVALPNLLSLVVLSSFQPFAKASAMSSIHRSQSGKWLTAFPSLALNMPHEA